MKRTLLVLGILLTPTAVTGQGQPSRLATTIAAGSVFRPGASGPIPIPDLRVVLHRVGRATQGPIDTTRTDGAGRFRFRFAADTTANFLLSANYAGIEYFSQPLATNPARPDTAVELLVYDTTSVDPVGTRSRTLVIGAPDAIGARTVVDWLVLANDGERTRVGADSTDPTWGLPLPAGVRNPALGDARLSQISPDAVLFRNDSVFVLAPLSPGDKELLLQYEIAPRTRRLAVDLRGIDSTDAFIEESGARIEGDGWRVRDSQLFEGRPFRRLGRTDSTVTSLTIRFPSTGAGPATLPILVGLTAVALMIGTWLRMRRPPAAPAGQGSGLAPRSPPS